ncbi:MAG TPA: sortase [Candidatus Saccharimonadales bacterium]|nr:sortase [Candidatus Saccharimonadales bacterium]
MKRTIAPKYAEKVKTRRKSKKLSERPIFTEVKRTKATQKFPFKLLTKITLWFGIICIIIVINTLIMRTFPVAKPHNFALSAHMTPAEIIIKDVNIDLPVVPAIFSNGTFQTTSEGASYLTSSPIPGDQGNSVIYAHNWSNLFGNLTNVKPGEKITIIFNNRSQKVFTIIETKTVSAYQTNILQPTQDKQITVFTCANFLDADRFVVIAKAN